MDAGFRPFRWCSSVSSHSLIVGIWAFAEVGKEFLTLEGTSRESVECRLTNQSLRLAC